MLRGISEFEELMAVTMRPPKRQKARYEVLWRGGFKRLGALFLKVMAVPMVPIGLGLMLYGLFQILHARCSGQPFLRVFRHWRHTDHFRQLALDIGQKARCGRALGALPTAAESRGAAWPSQRNGRLTVTETAADTGLTVEEASEILKRLADGGFVEVEITDSGLIVYRFPEVLFDHEKHWSRGVESA